MAFDATALIAFKGNFIVGVKTTTDYKMVDLVRLHKAIDNGIYDINYDMNRDGVLDFADEEILKTLILENIF